MVTAYWLIGKRIVEEDQQGNVTVQSAGHCAAAVQPVKELKAFGNLTRQALKEF